MPVGLFGEQRNTTSGRCRRTCSTADAGSRSNAPPPGTPRIPSTQVVPVVVVMIGCIEYAGVKPSAVRPGPPNACSRCRRTSFEPLPAQTCSADTRVPLRDR